MDFNSYVKHYGGDTRIRTEMRACIGNLYWREMGHMEGKREEGVLGVS